MSLQVGSGQITITSAGGTGSKTYAHGLSFTPTLILWFSNGTAAGSSTDGDAYWMFGASKDSTHEFCSYGWSDDANGTSASGSGTSNNASIAFPASATTYDMQADFTSVDGTNFTLNISDAPAADRAVQFVALAGTALSVDVGTVTIATGTSAQAFTGVGFQPKLVLWSRGGLVTQAVNTVAGTVSWGWGASTAAGAEITTTDADRNAQAVSDSNTSITALRGLIVPTVTGTTGGAFNLTSMDADGFTVTPSTSFGGNTVVGYVAIGGANFQAKTGSGTQKITSTGTVAHTGVGFKPQLLLTSGVAAIALNTVTVAVRSFFGVAHGSSNRVVSLISNDGADPTNTAVSTGGTTNIRSYSALSNAILSDAAVSSFDADGFTENYSVVSTAWLFAYVAMMENVAPVITSNGGGATAAIDSSENQTSVTTVTATDAEGDTLTYSISAGADAGLFEIDSSSGVLTWAAAPDFESKIDADADGVYEVTVQVSDGSLTDTQAISVTVTDAVEIPVVESSGMGPPCDEDDEIGSSSTSSSAETPPPPLPDIDFGFDTDTDGFDFGTRVAAEGVDFSTGYLSVGTETASRSFAAISSGTPRVDFAIRITDTQTIAGTTRNTVVYMLPTSGAVTSTNALTALTIVRNTADGATSAKVAVTTKQGGSFVNLSPATVPRQVWLRFGFVFNFTAKTFDMYLNDVLWIVGKDWANASAADLSRFVVLSQATTGTVSIDDVQIWEDWELLDEALMVSDDFTARPGEIETTTPATDTRSLYSQPWLIPDVAGTGGFLRGATGLTPDASAGCLAMVKCGRDGIFEADWTAASSGQIYMGLAFRVWAGIGSDSCDNFRYWSGASAGQELRLFVGSTAVASSAGTGFTVSASGSYTLKVVLRGIYAYCYVNGVLQFSGPVNIGNRGMLSEEHAGPIIDTALGTVSTTNRCRGFRWTGRIAEDQELFTATLLGKYTARVSGGFVKELYHSDLTLSTRNLFWSKGFQHSHISQGDMGNNRVMWDRLINGTYTQSVRERGLNIQEDSILGEGESYVTLLVRGLWIAEKVRYTGPGSSINFTPDMDLRPDLWSLVFRSADGSGSSTQRTAVIGDDWTTDETSTTGCKALQVITSGSGNKLRLTAALRDNLNTAGKTTQITHKRQGIGDPFSVAFNMAGSAMTYGTSYEFGRAVLFETGALSLDATTLTDFRDDIKTPATLTFSTGSIKTDAAGDTDADGFNERYGWHEITCSGGTASFTLVRGVPAKRYMPVFRLNGYSIGVSPHITIAGSLGVHGTDYVFETFAGSIAILQLLTNRTANTTVAIAV